jgi:serine protease Do
LGLKRDVRGAVIVEVAPGSPADKAGLSAGEIVVEVNRKATPSAEDALAALRGRGKKGAHLLRVRGPAGARFVTLEKASK